MRLAIIQQQSTNMKQQQPPEQRSKCNYANVADAPTHTDVLLGRGVSTNRHPGNENFRAIVGRHVEVYVTSTKKQKMNISKSIVEQVHKLNPPGRFLEKNNDTGLWQEVDRKRALEKTAQALRDGAAPLRKRMAEDLSNILFSEADSSDKNAAASPIVASFIPSFSNDTVYHQGPRSKKQRVASTVSSNPVVEVLCNMQRNQRAQLQQHNWGQSFLGSSSGSLPENQVGMSRMDTRLAQVLSHTYMQQISALQKKQAPQASTHISDSRLTSMPYSTTDDSPSTTSSKDANVAVTAQLIQDKNAIDEEQFAREMGPDEHFFDLCDSAPISDMNISDFDGGDINVISDGGHSSIISGTTDDSPSGTGSEDVDASSAEEFARAMGPDEHFFDLCDSDFDDGDIDILRSLDGILDD